MYGFCYEITTDTFLSSNLCSKYPDTSENFSIEYKLLLQPFVVCHECVSMEYMEYNILQDCFSNLDDEICLQDYLIFLKRLFQNLQEMFSR